ncbi:MAG: hypothetical protein EHM12_02455 [Dehalococcoidia bacterium]|nr:MAG: hypothetical protein EHM12_02455 [Dehalococcoidia bacterium]
MTETNIDQTKERLDLWCSAPDVAFETPQAEQDYRQRTRRISDAIQLKVPDRVPISPLVTFFPARYSGQTAQEMMYDPDKAYEAFKKVALDFQWDTAMNHINTLSGPMLEELDYKQLRWPGHGVPPDRSYQFVEAEYMKADEYDAFLDDPTGFMIRTYLPRICGTLAPFQLLPPLTMVFPYYVGLMLMIGNVAMTGAASAFESIIRAQEKFINLAMSVGIFNGEMQSLGFPILMGGTTQAPFDTLGDSLRGTQGIMLDMYRQPDKLLKALDKLLPSAIDMAVVSSAMALSPVIFIPLHKGARGFMSRKQFETFYWPTLHKLMLALIEKGLVPMPCFESDYSDRLDIIKDIPAGKAIYWFEKTDICKAKEELGDRVCLKGNVPSSIMCTGTPEQVREYCKKLIDVAGKNGGLIVDGDVGIPDEARVENVRAMTDFVKEYGVYK